MKQTSRGLAPSLNTGHSTFTGARQRLAVALVAIVIAFAGAQTAGAQNTCNVTFVISGEGTVEFREETVTNDQTIDFIIPDVGDLIITPETGYVVSSVTYDAPGGLSFDLHQDDDFHWSLYTYSYEGSDTPTITVRIVFDKALAGGADEASAVALTADDDFHLAGGWYKVESDLTLDHTVNLHGDTHIIIASGKTLTVSTSDEYGIYGSALTVSGEGTLAVSASESAISVDNYTQTGCAVTLSGDTHGLNAENNVSISGGSLTTSGATYGIDTDNGSITISGGTVSSSGKLCGLYAGAAVSITGGTVSASGNVGNGIRGLSVSITGGQVTASSGGIVSIFGDITLGWTSSTDYITASGYVLLKEGFYVKIADGQTLYGGGFPSASYTGTVDDPSALNGLMLRPTAAVTKSDTNEYTIRYADGWDAFCDRLAADDGKAFFSGKTVKLAADITVSRMAGSDGHDFCGTFDGGGKTLTVNYTNNNNNVMTAPFSYVNGATIQNLIVGGTISGTAYRAAGIVGETTGQTTITNCVSSVDISSGRYTGGISIGGLVTITGCVFDGKIVGTDRSGGFVGFSNTATAISNSLFAPQDGSSISGGTFYYNGGGDITPTNSYYTRTLGDAQGKQAHSITAGENVTVANAGTPETVYTVSGITAYTTGIKYNDVLYAGSGDAVSLTLSNTATGAPAGYQYDGYTASAGTLDDNNILTMPDEDVTVSVNTAVLTVLPWSGDGSEGNPYIIYNKDQLDLLAYRVNGTHGETLQEDGYSGKYFKLNNDISYTHTSAWNDFTSDESNYEAIGGYYGGNRSFRGHFDGNNKTISGIRINKDGYKRADRSQAIFGWTDYGADIHNLTLADARITGHYYTGGIVGYNDGGTVTRCHVAGDVAVCAVHVQPGADYHGGIVGNNNWGIIEQCTSAATLTTANATSTQNYGGIAGRNSGTLSDNLAIGATVPAAANNTYGAITGYNGGTLERNYYTACKVANVENATGVGCGYIDDGVGGYITADVNNDNNPDGAVCINTLALAANQAPDQNYWTTYYNSALGFTIDADENACAYTAEYDGANSQLTLHKLGKVIPKNTAVIIVGADNEISMTASDETVTVPTNNLDGVDVRTLKSTLGSGTFYVLSKQNDKFGFFQYNAQYMPARKAYLLIADSSAPSLTMVFDNETTEIKTTDFTDYTDKADIWYSLDGRKLDKQPTAKGIYIHNGRKEVVR